MTSTEIRRTFFDLSDKDVDEAERTALIRQFGFGKASDWDDVLESRLILLLSEAQSGKTHECKARQQALWEAGQPAFYIELSSVASQPWRELRSPDETERLERWRCAEAEIATIFLDSVDELKLTQRGFQAALRNVANDLQGQMARLRVVLTSRPLPVDRDLFLKTFAAPKSPPPLSENPFVALAMGETREKEKADGPPEVRFVSLMPLSSADVAKLAASRGVRDTAAFLEGLETSSMLDFMRRPQDVIEAASAWNELGGRFGTHAQQVELDIKVRLKPNVLRPDRQLEDARALEGAKRLALAVVLTQRLTIRHDVNNDLGDAPPVVDPAVILPDWRDDDRKGLLERALFGFASYGRVRFHNRLAFEFLAAWRLADLVEVGMSRKALRRLLTVQTAQGFTSIRPSLREVAAWLALRQRWVFDLVITLDPALLMNLGDPGRLSAEQRREVLAAFIERFGKGGWRGLSVPQIQVHRLADTSLASIISAEFDAIENPEVREILLDLIRHARLHDCAHVARRVVWDPKVELPERIDALNAMIALEDPDLPQIVEELRVGPGRWGQDFARSAIYRLFPQHMSVNQFLAVLSWVQETRRTGAELSRNLPPRIEGLTVERLEELRFGLTPLVEDGFSLDVNLRTSRNKRPHLVHLLAATCALLLSAGALTAPQTNSVALAAELARGMRSDDAIPSKLSEAVASALPEVRAAFFVEHVALTRRLRPERPRLDLFMELAWRGALRLRQDDSAWMRELLSTSHASADLRAAALLMEVFAFAPGNESRGAYLESLRPLVSDDTELAGFLEERLKPPVRSRTERRWAVCNARRKRQEERRKAKDKASWVMFWRNLKDDPDAAFSPEHAENTAWNLLRVMARGGARSNSSGWDRQLMEEHLGKQITDRLRCALLPLWRRETPPLPSERPEKERNIYFHRWTLALAAIAAEAEDAEWAARLKPSEAETAVRYVPLSSSNFPAWLDPLAAAHPTTVERVLGGEVSWTLSLPAKANARSILLQDIHYANPEVARLFLPRLRLWIESGPDQPAPADDASGAADRLEQVIEILLKFGDGADREAIGKMASSALAKGSSEQFSRVLLPALFEVDPERAVERLEAICSEVSVSRESAAVAWFAKLFGGLHRGQGVDLRHPGMTADLLLRLLRLAYRHVEREEDNAHEGSYSPGTRDTAETGRNMLLNAVIELGGADGWKAKQDIANEPEFAHLRERLRALAMEKSAREADNLAMRPEEVRKLDDRREPAPRSAAEMFVLMLDRLDDLHEHMLEDTSPRELWSSIKDERVMRREIARFLETHARGAYSIAQENVTVDEKETDIRLRSQVSAIEGVIELKIGDKDYSGTDLKAVISEQLVSKYLAPTGRRAGCLMITRAERDGWQHPDTGEHLDFDGLIAMLQDSAKAVQLGFPDEIHIQVVGLDLKPRLTTEREAKVVKRTGPRQRASPKSGTKN